MATSSHSAKDTAGGCLACGAKPPFSPQPGDSPCPCCGSVVQILETRHGLVVVVKPPSDFCTSLSIQGHFRPLPSNLGRCSAAIIDLADADLLSSSAIAEIVALHKDINAMGRRLELVMDASVIRESLHSKCLDQVLSIHSCVREALESL